MIKSTSIFSQILGLISRDKFSSLVKFHSAEKHSKGLSCWQQFVAMIFCQLGHAHSLRDITDGLSSCEGKLTHLGIKPLKHNTLAYANSKRPAQLFEDLFFYLLGEVKSKANITKHKFKFKNKLYSIDSTTIDLCIKSFDWAKFRRTKGAIKLHVRLDHDGYLPDYCVITDGKTSDIRATRQWEFASGAIYVIDRGYNDYALFDKITNSKAFFVTRAKDNAKYTIEDTRPSGNPNIILDSTIIWTHPKAKESCPGKLRLVTYKDPETGEIFDFLTNNKTLSPTTIAGIYKDRWGIEAFFKNIKQNLKIKTFVGTSANAVKIQIWTALITILLLKYLKMKSTLKRGFSNFIALLRLNLFAYKDLYSWINNPFGENESLNDPDLQMSLQL
jgi:hypothetical protein